MADSIPPSGDADGPAIATDGPAAEFVVGGSQWHPMTTAVLVGGAIAATAGAVLGTRALARRHAGSGGRAPNSVMAAAMTACALASRQSAAEPEAAREPAVPKEPAVAPE